MVAKIVRKVAKPLETKGSRRRFLKDEVSSFPPAFVHCYDAALLKHSITIIHDCIRVFPRDIDRALNRIETDPL